MSDGSYNVEAPPEAKWKNPFIDKLASFSDIIFTCPRLEPESLKPQVLERISKHQRLILELCSGSGAHLIELAARNSTSANLQSKNSKASSALCIGVELRFKRLVRTAEKSKERGVDNLNLLQIDAQVLPKVLSPESCDQIFINFPDPWDGKSRWEDKYLLSKDYLIELNKLLKSGGTFHYKTDHARRFKQVASLISELDSIFAQVEYSEDLHKSEFNSANILTEFERLFASKKQPVFYLKAQKRS